ncbi:MAG: response regulator, partial [Chloroflexi bacterium]
MLPTVSADNNKNIKILIVDDETETGQFIVRLLRRQNYQMSTVLSGEEALAHLETNPDTEIILLDLMMPGIDGFEVLEHVKSNPATAHIKVIVVTAINRVQDKVKAFSLGAADFLVKPFNKGELIARIETQAHLKRAEEKINALARFPIEAPHPILRISAGGELLYSNLAGLELLQDHPGQTNPDVPVSWHNTVRQVLQTNHRTEVEYQNGHKIYTCMFVPLVNQGYVNVYGTDITDRIRMEKALRKSEERHRTLAENARDLITKLTPDGTLTYVSAASLPILGYPPQELLGHSLYELIHPDDRAEIEQMNPPVLDPASEAVFTVRFKHKNDSYVWLESSVRGVRAGGANDVELVVVARNVTERKRYEAALQQAYDELEERVAQRTAALSYSNNLLKQVIEERKQAETRILKFNQELLALQYAGAAIASSLDLEYVLHTVTSEMVDMLNVEGCAISEWDHNTGTASVSAKFGPDDWWTAGSLADESLAAEVLHRREYQQVIATPAAPLNGNIKSLLVLPLVFRDHDIGYVEIADSQVARTFTNQEITLAQLLASQAASAIQNARLYQQAQQEIAERKRMEETLEKSRATLARRIEERTAELSAANAQLSRAARLKDEFLASMSHELRTPLNAVLSMSEALQEEMYGGLNQKQHQSLKNIEESGRHLLALINDILDLSKIEAGKLELQTEPVSVQQVCSASLIFIKQTAHKKRIKVLSKIDNQAVALKADERRLKQMLVNLLSNAVKFTPEGGTVGLEVIADAERQAINFTVWDTGIGIP